MTCLIQRQVILLNAQVVVSKIEIASCAQMRCDESLLHKIVYRGVSMFPEECKNFINQYVSNDHTNRALYLHAPHGHGKTHFLKEELSQQENISYKCIMVSLSGITTLAELSKAIFLAAHQCKNTAKAKRAKTVSHIIAKNVAAQFNIDLSLSEKELQTFYDVVNFRNRLLVIDDVECATQFHGFWDYIKGLLFDDVKVLLVSSEDPPYQEEQIASIIGDKLKFKYESKVPSLIAHEISKATNCAAMTAYIKKHPNWIKLTSLCKCENLHILRFAIEKTCKIINKCSIYDKLFICQILKNILLLSPLYLSASTISLPPQYEYSITATQRHVESRYIIYHACASYLQTHIIDVEKIKHEHSIYIDSTHLDRQYYGHDCELHNLYNWRELNEDDIQKSISELESALTHNSISWFEYHHILICLQYICGERQGLDININRIIDHMKHNLRGQTEFLMHRHIDLNEITGVDTCLPDEFVQQLTNALQQPYEIPCDFTYKSDDFHDYFLSLPRYYDIRLYNHRYLAAYDITLFASMFQHPSAKLCHDAQELLHHLYDLHDAIAPEELHTLQVLRQSIDNILAQKYLSRDMLDILRSFRDNLNQWIIKFQDTDT